MTMRSHKNLWLACACLVATGCWGEGAVADANGTDATVVDALNNAIRSTHYAALVKHTGVERLPLPDENGSGDEILRYQLAVEETFRGHPLSSIRYDMVVEAGEAAVSESGLVIIVLCQVDGRYFWPGTGSIFPATPALIEQARRSGAEGVSGQQGFAYCD